MGNPPETDTLEDLKARCESLSRLVTILNLTLAQRDIEVEDLKTELTRTREELAQADSALQD